MGKDKKPDLGARAKEALDRAREAKELPDPWKPTQAGEYVVGEITGIRIVKMRDGRTPKVVSLKLEDGEEVAVWGSGILRDEMDAAEGALKVGATIAVAYDGEFQTKNDRTAKDYTLTVLS